PLLWQSALVRPKQDFDRELLRAGKRNRRHEQPVLDTIEAHRRSTIDDSGLRRALHDDSVTIDFAHAVEPPDFRRTAGDANSADTKRPEEVKSHEAKLRSFRSAPQLILWERPHHDRGRAGYP